jgi:D-arabinose 1-dehydrogenase-like Zn-dependent alcohol dehydrogenase
VVGAAPLLCAGITVWSPFVHHKLGPKHRVGIVGVGGLGHLAVQFGVKFGCHTTGMSTQYIHFNQSKLINDY